MADETDHFLQRMKNLKDEPVTPAHREPQAKCKSPALSGNEAIQLEVLSTQIDVFTSEIIELKQSIDFIKKLNSNATATGIKNDSQRSWT